MFSTILGIVGQMGKSGQEKMSVESKGKLRCIFVDNYRVYLCTKNNCQFFIFKFLFSMGTRENRENMFTCQ